MDYRIEVLYYTMNLTYERFVMPTVILIKPKYKLTTWTYTEASCFPFHSGLLNEFL